MPGGLCHSGKTGNDKIMDLTSELLKENSVGNINSVTQYFIDHPEELESLISLVDHKNVKVKNRASWVLSKLGEKIPSRVATFYNQLFDIVAQTDSGTIRRNLMRGLQFLEIPEELEGRTIDLCLLLLQDKNQPIAVKAIALTISSGIALKYPEFSGELESIIMEQLPYASPGFKHRANKILRQITI